MSTKKNAPKNWELCLIQQTFWRLQAQEKTSLLRDTVPKREESGYIEILHQRPGSLELQKITVKENQTSHVDEFSIFSVKMQESGLIEIIPLICTSMARKVFSSFPSWLPSGCSGWWLEGHSILSLLIWLATFFIRRGKGEPKTLKGVLINKEKYLENMAKKFLLPHQSSRSTSNWKSMTWVVLEAGGDESVRGFVFRVQILLSAVGHFVAFGPR